MFKLNSGDVLYGFRVTAVYENFELSLREYHMTHEKCGARLIFSERRDDNMTFAVGFRSFPEDNTGVFHIIEHCTLCGSRRFPVKEPFVELLKSSLQTSLNAYTCPDKTIYYLSSKNGRDFLNLAEVYLDAVFHPLMTECPEIFYSEGIHPVIDEGGSLTYSGVVESEMRGASSGYVRTLQRGFLEMLYGKGSPYANDSGGVPRDMEALTYEDFLAAYKKYYHPSNARFFLDGSLPLDETLALIDSYLREFERREFDTDIPVLMTEFEKMRECEYEIGEEESESCRTVLGLDFLASAERDSVDNDALGVICDVIAGTDSAPLYRAVLDSGLCEGFTLSTASGTKHGEIIAMFTNVKDGAEADIRELFFRELEALFDKPEPREAIEALLDGMEFNLREQNHTEPFGITLMDEAFDVWDWQSDARCISLPFSICEQMRRLPEGAYYELLRKYVLENERAVCIIAHPSSALAARRREEDRVRREARLLSLGDAEKAKIIERAEKTLRYLEREPSERELATLPRLKLSEIKRGIYRVPTDEAQQSDVKIIRHDFPWNGVYYINLHFDISDFCDMPLLRLFTEMLSSSGTDKYSAFDFETRKNRLFGSLKGTTEISQHKDGGLKIYFSVYASMLERNKDECMRALCEYLFDTTLDDKAKLRNFIDKTTERLHRYISESGSGIGMVRSRAYVSASARARDDYSYIGFYERLLSLRDSLDSSADELIGQIKALAKRIFVRDRLTLSVIGEPDRELEKRVTELIPESNEKISLGATLEPLGSLGENFDTVSSVGFAVLTCPAARELSDGIASVAFNILNYEYLWYEVRSVGKSYGVDAFYTGDRQLVFSSYRDPSPRRTLDVFRGAPDFLREFVNNTPDISSYIIGTIGGMESCQSDPMRAMREDTRRLLGMNYETVERIRREVLDCTRDDLLSFADILEESLLSANEMLLAPRELLGDKGNIRTL